MGIRREHPIRRRATATLAAAVVAVVASSCSSDAAQTPTTTAIAGSVAGSPVGSSPATAGSTVLTTDALAARGYTLRTSGVPRVEESGCAPGVSTMDRVHCLTLVVPESRHGPAAANGRLVHVPVVIIEANGPRQSLQPDPVLWVNYDAGDGMLAGRARVFSDESHPLNVNRDAITLDYRGSGAATPSLACPEVTKLNIGAFAADVDETSPEGRAMRLDAIGQCHDRLVGDGVDLSAYASADAAQDLEDLRNALGIKQWNVVAGEYGTKLAQLLIRDHPDGLRSVVMNSTPIPLQADYFGELASNASRGWLAVVAACKADVGCAGAFPTLSSDVTALVADLAAKPRRFDQFNAGGNTVPFVFRVARLLYQMVAFRDNYGIPVLPMGLESKSALEADYSPIYIPAVEGGMDTYSLSTWGLWEVFPQNSNDTDGTFALGAHLSAACSDEAPFTDPQHLAAADAVPLFGPLLAHNADLDACAVWKVNASPASANEAVHGDVPTLVLAGDLDTMSSPAWADSFKPGLTAVTVVHFATSGTQPTSGPDTTAYACSRQVRDAFLAQPTATLDLSCVATSHGPSFVLP